mgnify:CR=1 FL=1
MNDVRKILRSRSSLVSAAVSNTDSIVLGLRQVDRVIRSYFKHRDSLRPISREDL